MPDRTEPDRPPPPLAKEPLPLWAVLAAVALAVLLVLAVVAGWRTLQSHHHGPQVLDDPPAVLVPPVPLLSPVPSPTGTGPVPSAHPSQPADTSPSSRPPSTAPSRSGPAAVDRSVPVVVLNATSRTGLAARAARSLESMGWTVVAVGNWRHGGVSRTTVFASGHHLAALTLRADARVGPGVRTPLPAMPTGRLVLVLGPDYRG